MTVSGRRIFVNTAYRAAAELGSKVATFVLFVLMARKLGSAQFGIFTFALSITGLTTIIGDFGQNAVLTRAVARDRDAVHYYFANNLVLRVLLAGGSLAIVVAALWFTSDRRTVEVVAIVGLAFIFELLRGTCTAIFEAHERLGFLPIVLITQRVLGAAAAAVLLYHGADLVDVSLAYCGSAVVGFLIALTLLLRRVVVPRLEVDVGRWWPIMWQALPLGIAGVFGTVLFRVDASILAAFEPKAIVGEYGAAYRVFESTLFIGWAIGSATYPVFSRLASSAELGPLFARVMKSAIGLTLPLTAAGIVLARPLIEALYGSGYGRSARALQLLAPTVMLYTIAYLCGVFLVAQHRQRVMSIVLGIGALENIAANFVLIPLYSLDGAALNTSLSQLVVSVPLIVIGARVVGGVSWSRMLVGPTVASLVAAAPMFVLRSTPVAALGSGVVTYFLVLALVERVAFPDDARAFLRLVRRPPFVPDAASPL
jgi:O-antigen/teichoic acid export membrane protein